MIYFKLGPSSVDYYSQYRYKSNPLGLDICIVSINSSFLVIHKMGNVSIKVDTVVSDIYLDSKYHVKCKFASKFIHY